MKKSSFNWKFNGEEQNHSKPTIVPISTVPLLGKSVFVFSVYHENSMSSFNNDSLSQDVCDLSLIKIINVMDLINYETTTTIKFTRFHFRSTWVEVFISFIFLFELFSPFIYLICTLLCLRNKRVCVAPNSISPKEQHLLNYLVSVAKVHCLCGG